jgi:hypothetical protein
MKALFAAALFFGSTAGAMAVESYSDYRDYFDAKPAAADRASPRGFKTKAYTADDVDTRRHDDGPVAGKADPLKPGYRNGAGLYVPPEYSTHPRGPVRDGFGSSADGSYGSASAPNPFAGSLGTRR